MCVFTIFDMIFSSKKKPKALMLNSFFPTITSEHNICHFYKQMNIIQE